MWGIIAKALALRDDIPLSVPSLVFVFLFITAAMIPPGRCVVIALALSFPECTSYITQIKTLV
jgi:hypothetical protein